MERLRKYGSSNGFTLAELLIVVVIIGVIALIFLLMNWRKSIYAGNDVKRKTDIVNIRRAFEEYYNDTNCYPSTDIMLTCGGSGLAPYIDKIPCDPITGKPYLYVPANASNVCLGNRLCTQLQDWSDPDITKLGCDPEAGCGWGAKWNYCISTGTTVLPMDSVGINISPSPSPTPTPSWYGSYACRPGIQVGGVIIMNGQCNNVGDPGAYGCQYSFVETDCQGLCNQIPYWCAQ
ncbi:MAG: prepilin-type N-terminal cleavage/methylation domain-containing protein [Patescibacteria group bacterium]